MLGNRLCDHGRSGDPFDGCHTTRPLPGTVHAAGVELHHPVRIREATEPDSRLLRIPLRDVHPGDEGVQYVLALRDPAERPLDRTLGSAVLVADAADVGDDDRVDGSANEDGRGVSTDWLEAGPHPYGGSRFDKLSAIHGTAPRRGGMTTGNVSGVSPGGRRSSSANLLGGGTAFQARKGTHRAPVSDSETYPPHLRSGRSHALEARPPPDPLRPRPGPEGAIRAAPSSGDPIRAASPCHSGDRAPSRGPERSQAREPACGSGLRLPRQMRSRVPGASGVPGEGQSFPSSDIPCRRA